MPEDNNLVENKSMLFYLAPFQKEKSISKGGRDLLSHPPLAALNYKQRMIALSRVLFSPFVLKVMVLLSLQAFVGVNSRWNLCYNGILMS